MGCGCKKRKTQTVSQPPVVEVNQTQNQSTSQVNEDVNLVDLIIEKLNTIEEEKTESE